MIFVWMLFTFMYSIGSDYSLFFSKKNPDEIKALIKNISDSINFETAKWAAQKIFHAIIGLSPSEDQFRQQLFFPWTDKQKESMKLLLEYGIDPNMPSTLSPGTANTPLFYLFQFCPDGTRNNVLLEKVQFMINELFVSVNPTDDQGTIIPSLYAQQIACSTPLYEKNSHEHSRKKFVISDPSNLSLPVIVEKFSEYGGDLSLANNKGRNLLYYVIRYWQPLWDCQFLKNLVTKYKIPVQADSNGNTLIHAVAKSTFFCFTKTANFEECSAEFKCRWDLFSYICSLLSFIDLNQKNSNDQTPVEIVSNNSFGSLDDKNKCHIVTYAYEKYYENNS